MNGFMTVQADQDHRLSGKTRGGGLALLVNNRWCHPFHITVKECICTPNIELLAVSLRPYYLPTEFTCAVAIVVNIPPSADADTACDVINSVTAKMQMLSLQSLGILIMPFSLHHSPLFTNLSCALPETIKRCFYFMQTHWMHTYDIHSPSSPWQVRP